MQIMVNGQSYDDWSKVPADIRAQLAAKLPDADGNGVPDLFEGGGLPAGAQVVSSSSITVDDKVYHSVAELPPDIQQALRDLLPGALQAAAGVAPAAPTPPAAAPPAANPPLADGQVMLNGVPTQVTEPAKKKRWWQRG